MYKNYFFVFSLLLFLACEQEPEYQKHESGLRYAYIVENPEANYAKPGDILSLRMKYFSAKDSLLFNSDEVNSKYRMQFQAKSHTGGCLEDAYSLLRIGDSLVCKINAFDFYEHTRKMPVPQGIDPTEELTFFIKLYGIQSYSDISKERQAARTNSAESEQSLLEDYLKKSNITVDPTLSGMYIIKLEEGKGPAIKPGNKVSIHYVGKLIDQSIFDNSYKRNEPLEFTLGKGELIKGMEEGIAGMKQGGKARLIIPSLLAYDSAGYGQLIPPYATLIFEVEVVNIQPN